MPARVPAAVAFIVLLCAGCGGPSSAPKGAALIGDGMGHVDRDGSTLCPAGSEAIDGQAPRVDLARAVGARHRLYADVEYCREGGFVTGIIALSVSSSAAGVTYEGLSIPTRGTSIGRAAWRGKVKAIRYIWLVRVPRCMGGRDCALIYRLTLRADGSRVSYEVV